MNESGVASELDCESKLIAGAAVAVQAKSIDMAEMVIQGRFSLQLSHVRPC